MALLVGVHLISYQPDLTYYWSCPPTDVLWVKRTFFSIASGICNYNMLFLTLLPHSFAIYVVFVTRESFFPLHLLSLIIHVVPWKYYHSVVIHQTFGGSIWVNWSGVEIVLIAFLYIWCKNMCLGDICTQL